MVIAGVLTLEDALHLVVARGRLMSEHCQIRTSGMLAVKANSAHISKILQDCEDLSIACYNRFVPLSLSQFVRLSNGILLNTPALPAVWLEGL